MKRLLSSPAFNKQSNTFGNRAEGISLPCNTIFLKTMKCFCLCCLLCLLSVFVSVAENMHNYYFRHYTNKDGLSHNTVYYSLQDQKGFMWFATEDGLNRFDGQQFTVYRNNSWQADNEGLLHDRIVSLFEDSTGKIWICTLGGTCFYDYATNKFTSLKTTSGDYSQHYFRLITQDKQNNLWFIDYDKTLKHNLETGKDTLYKSPGFIHGITTQEGDPVFAGIHDIWLHNHESDKFTAIPVLSADERQNDAHISVIREVPQGGFLVGTDRVGLKMYYSGTGKTETVIPDIQVRDILCYRPNIYWIATESGIYIYNMTDKSVINLRKSLTNEYTIADNAVYSLTRDREGGVWLGSFFGGIDYLPVNHRNFTYYLGGKTHSGMLGNTVREIQPDKYGHLWLSTEDNGINRFDPHTGEMINYSPLNPQRKIRATNIHGIYPQGDTLWIGSFNKGIDLLHIPSGKIIKYYDQANSGIGNFVLCFTPTSDNEFLVGTSEGVFFFDPARQRFFRWYEIGGLIRQIYEDSKGRVWIASNTGLCRVDRKKEESPINYYNATDITASSGLGSDIVTSVCEDSKGRIWVTTAYGFSMYSEEEDTFNRFTTRNGLPGNMIYRIVEDDAGKFWISTANGLVYFDPETNRMRTYSHKDGLHESQFNYCSSYKATDGTIYMGTIDGMISFHPQQFEEDYFSPPLYITQVHIPDHPKKNKEQQNTVSYPQNIVLPYHVPTFTISYIAPCYTSPQTIHYSYMLEGIDKDWKEMGTSREVAFTHLSPGKYTFRVRSTNSSHVWQQNEQSIEIVITPPWWATVGAYIVYFLLFVSLSIAFYRYKKNRLIRKRQQQLFETEKEKEQTPTTVSALSPSDELFLQKLNKYINENLTNQRLNVEMIANEMGMSTSSLYRKVKAIYNLSPVDFIRITRLKKAVQLMQEGEKVISEIAYRTGFSSPAYFSTCFQKQYGKSPSEFLKEKIE